MSFTHSFVGYVPPPRYDGDPWTQVRVEESATEGGAYTAVETLPLSPVDADPSSPAARNVTTDEATLEEGWFRLIFLDAAGQASPASTPVRSPGASSSDGYPSRVDLVAASGVTELTALSGSQQDALRQEAITAIEGHTGQRFTVEGTAEAPVTKLADGSGGDVVYLPARLEQLVSLAHNGLAVNLADVTVAHDRLVMVNPLGAGSWVTRAYRRSQDRPEPVWEFGRANIAISGVWGWSECPSAVATALRFHMEDRARAEANKLAATVRSARALGLGSVRQGNVSIDIAGEEPILSARARRELVDLVWEGGGGFAA